MIRQTFNSALRRWENQSLTHQLASQIPNWDYWYSAPSLHGACSLDRLHYFTRHDNNQPVINRSKSEKEEGSTGNPQSPWKQPRGNNALSHWEGQVRSAAPKAWALPTLSSRRQQSALLGHYRAARAGEARPQVPTLFLCLWINRPLTVCQLFVLPWGSVVQSGIKFSPHTETCRIG